MLVLTVKPGESFVVGNATIKVCSKNRICIDAPREVRIVRSSVLEREKNGEEKARRKTIEPTEEN